MRIAIDYDPDPDFSFCDEDEWDCPSCGTHNDNGAACANYQCGHNHIVSLCTVLYDEGGSIIDSLGNSTFYADSDDWTTGTFDSVEQIPGRCEHLREIASAMLASYTAPIDPLRAAAQAALTYLEDDCEPHWSPEQRDVVEALRTALREG